MRSDELCFLVYQGQHYHYRVSIALTVVNLTAVVRKKNSKITNLNKYPYVFGSP